MIIVEESIDQMNIARLQAAWTPRIHDFQPPPRGRVELLVEEKTSTILFLLGKNKVFLNITPKTIQQKPKGKKNLGHLAAQISHSSGTCLFQAMPRGSGAEVVMFTRDSPRNVRIFHGDV
jgi:hypothetical protein